MYRYMKVPKLNTSILKLYMYMYRTAVHVLSSAYFLKKNIHVPGTLGTSSTWYCYTTYYASSTWYCYPVKPGISPGQLARAN